MWSYISPHEDVATDRFGKGGSPPIPMHVPLGLATSSATRAPRGIDPLDFRRVMGQFATGVAVITTLHRGELCGMTANSVTSISLEPVIILVSIARNAHTGAAILETGRFVVNILRDDQEELSHRFARPSPEKFDGVDVEVDEGDAPRLSDCLAYVICRVSSIVPAGDHDVVFAQVVKAQAAGGSPLLFYRGGYHRLPAEAGER